MESGTIHNGSAMMPKVIGTGCLLGAVVASFIGLEKGQELKSLETANVGLTISLEKWQKKRPKWRSSWNI